MKTVLGPDASTCGTSSDLPFVDCRIDSDRDRLRREFLSMPALCLTVEQVGRLLDLPIAAASHLLAGLERDGVLTRTASGRYRLAEPLLSRGDRDATAAEPIEADVLRIRHEFLGRPDLQLSSRTVALLLNISLRQADRLLASLVREGFLQKESSGEYRRAVAA
jgi:DNA-binding IclR family transcriptional regulator